MPVDPKRLSRALRRIRRGGKGQFLYLPSAGDRPPHLAVGAPAVGSADRWALTDELTEGEEPVRGRLERATSGEFTFVLDAPHPGLARDLAGPLGDAAKALLTATVVPAPEAPADDLPPLTSGAPSDSAETAWMPPVHSGAPAGPARLDSDAVSTVAMDLRSVFADLPGGAAHLAEVKRIEALRDEAARAFWGSATGQTLREALAGVVARPHPDSIAALQRSWPDGSAAATWRQHCAALRELAEVARFRLDRQPPTSVHATLWAARREGGRIPSWIHRDPPPASWLGRKLRAAGDAASDTSASELPAPAETPVLAFMTAHGGAPPKVEALRDEADRAIRRVARALAHTMQDPTLGARRKGVSALLVRVLAARALLQGLPAPPG